LGAVAQFTKDDKMKLTRFADVLLMGAVLSVAAIGCKHSPQEVTPIPNPSATGSTKETEEGLAVTNAGGEATPTPMANPEAYKDYTPDESKFEADTVHFDYDSSVVKSSEQSKVEDVANFMKANPGDALQIQGHCDERGTDQYNYALGERRALALREDLIGMGVNGSRILTVSYGRSRPVDTGHSDAAHARNRRGVFVLLTPP
jgi:peptidoglycan-associated lipoprotein